MSGSAQVVNLFEPGGKACSRCRVVKARTEFNRNKVNRDGLNYLCRECSRAYHRADQRKRRAENPKYLGYTRKRNLWNKYGLTLAGYADLLASQHGCCGICKRSPGQQSRKTGRMSAEVFDVDHDHNSGKVRGLLCSTCNRALGLFNDCAVALRNAAEYLETRSPKK